MFCFVFVVVLFFSFVPHCGLFCVVLIDLGFARYKYLVHCIIGERREQGLRVGNRCLWDENTDLTASETFTNVCYFPPSLFLRIPFPISC